MSNIKKFEKGHGGISDEALERMIADIESEPLLRPPKEFKNDILIRIRRRRKTVKNVKLFSYSAKVTLTVAAAIAIMIFVPWDAENVKDSYMPSVYRQEREIEEQKPYEERAIWRLNRRLNEYCDRLNDGLGQLIRMEGIFNEKEKE